MQISEMKRKIAFFSLFTLILIFGLYFSRFIIFGWMANFLMVEDELSYVEYAFVLSGNALDRGQKAAQLYHEGKFGQLICLGANQSNDLKSLGVDTLESELTHLQLRKEGVPAEDILLFPVGTSTAEEAEFILSYCLQKGILEIAVVSSCFHTKRVEQVFKKSFKKQGITVYIKGAPSSIFEEDRWWENEYGLIALNNEYLKQVYYLFKH